jgi:hypothetical protein
VSHDDKSYLESVTPVAVWPNAICPYKIRTQNIVEHSYGVFWVADLYNQDNIKVGTIEQMGRGGPDEVHVAPEHRQDWINWVKAAYPDSEYLAEESATAYLMMIEDNS